MFFTRCQESKPASPLGLKVVCTFPSKFHRGLLCYLAHAWHPAESKCSKLKACCRQQLCCSKQEKAEERKGWEAKILWYCHKWSTSQSSTSLLPPPLLITLAVRKHQPNSTNECLISMMRCGRGRQATCSWLILYLSITLFLSLSTPLFLFYFLLFIIFLYFPPTPLRQRSTKGETEEKQYNLLALICGAHQSMSGLRHSFACPLKALISLWFQPNGSALWQMLNFPSVTDTHLFSVVKTNWLCLDCLAGCLNKAVTWMLMWVLI